QSGLRSQAVAQNDREAELLELRIEPLAQNREPFLLGWLRFRQRHHSLQPLPHFGSRLPRRIQIALVAGEQIAAMTILGGHAGAAGAVTLGDRLVAVIPRRGGRRRSRAQDEKEHSEDQHYQRGYIREPVRRQANATGAACTARVV